MPCHAMNCVRASALNCCSKGPTGVFLLEWCMMFFTISIEFVRFVHKFGDRPFDDILIEWLIMVCRRRHIPFHNFQLKYQYQQPIAVGDCIESSSTRITYLSGIEETGNAFAGMHRYRLSSRFTETSIYRLHIYIEIKMSMRARIICWQTIRLEFVRAIDR